MPVPLLPPDRGRGQAPSGDDVLAALDVFTAGQFHHQGFVHRGDGWEVEGVQALHRREPGGPDTPLYHALVAVDEFQFGQPEQVFGVAHIFGGALGGHFPVFPQEAGQPQLLEVVFQQQCGPLAHAALLDKSVM